MLSLKIKPIYGLDGGATHFIAGFKYQNILFKKIQLMILPTNHTSESLILASSWRLLSNSQSEIANKLNCKIFIKKKKKSTMTPQRTD